MGRIRVSSQKAVFLDRDGVLVEAVMIEGKPHAAMSLDQFVIKPEAQKACDILQEAGFLLVVVTNQPEVARGNLPSEQVERMNSVLTDQLHLDQVVTCCHDDADECECRKPKPGMLTETAQLLSIDLDRSYMIGDRWKDIEAGRAAGCKTIWIDLAYEEQKPSSPTLRVTSLLEAVRWIENDDLKKPVSGTL
jgi:D-glycero-D-manno-heptose 1,7-bisphosphate phosphatase